MITHSTNVEQPATVNHDDMGALSMRVDCQNGRVVLSLAEPVACIGLTGSEAFDLAKKLIRHAREVGGVSLVLPRRKD